LKDYFTTEDFPSYLMEETGVSKIAAKKNYEAQKRNLERLRGKNAFLIFINHYFKILIISTLAKHKPLKFLLSIHYSLLLAHSFFLSTF